MWMTDSEKKRKKKVAGSLATYSVQSGTSIKLKVKKGNMIAFSAPVLMSMKLLGIEGW